MITICRNRSRSCKECLLVASFIPGNPCRLKRLGSILPLAPEPQPARALLTHEVAGKGENLDREFEFFGEGRPLTLLRQGFGGQAPKPLPDSSSEARQSEGGGRRGRGEDKSRQAKGQ